MLPDVDHEQEVRTVGQELTGPRVLEVAVVLVVEAPQGLPAREAEDRLSRLPEARDLDAADSSLHPDLGLRVTAGLAELDLAVRFQDAQTAEVGSVHRGEPRHPPVGAKAQADGRLTPRGEAGP